MTIMINVVLWIVAIIFVPLVLHCLVLTYKAIWDTWCMWHKEYNVNASWRAYEKRKRAEDLKRRIESDRIFDDVVAAADDEKLRKIESYEYMLYTLAKANEEAKKGEDNDVVA